MAVTSRLKINRRGENLQTKSWKRLSNEFNVIILLRHVYYLQVIIKWDTDESPIVDSSILKCT